MVTTLQPLIGKSRVETAVPRGIVATEKHGSRWKTTVHQASQLDGWQLESETWLEASTTHKLVVRLAREV